MHDAITISHDAIAAHMMQSSSHDTILFNASLKYVPGPPAGHFSQTVLFVVALYKKLSKFYNGSDERNIVYTV